VIEIGGKPADTTTKATELVTEPFLVTGDQAFAVASLMPGGEVLDPDPPDFEIKGDPSMTMVVATEQFRTKYVFLAPDDYTVSFADVVAPKSTKLKL